MGKTYVYNPKRHASEEYQKWISVIAEHDDVFLHSSAHWRCLHPEHRPHPAVLNRKNESSDVIIANLIARGYQTSCLDSGQYFPRIWRGGERYKDKERAWWYPLPFVEELPELESFVVALQQLEILFDDLTSVFRNVHPSPTNRTAFGSRIRNLLILASTEVECQWRAVLEANGSQPISQRFSTIDYHKLHSVLKLDEYKLSLRRYPHYPELCPFAGWNAQKPTKSLLWYDAYNEVKHDREDAFEKASLEHTTSAVGACVILLASQFGSHSLERFDLKNLFEFKSIPVWPITEWYNDSVAGEQWRSVQFPL